MPPGLWPKAAFAHSPLVVGVYIALRRRHHIVNPTSRIIGSHCELMTGRGPQTQTELAELTDTSAALVEILSYFRHGVRITVRC